jgi:hypothetical protein
LAQKRKLRLNRFIVIFSICFLSFAILVNAHGNFFLTNSQTSAPTNQVADYLTANGTISQSNNTIANLADVEVLGLKNGQLLVWNATAQKWQNEDSSQPNSTLAKLTDVTFAGLSNGDIMQYNSTTQKWENTRLTMTVQQIIDAYSTMAYKSIWDGSIIQLINSWANTTTLTNPQQPYSYLIYTNGDKYYAKNGTDGTVSFNSTDASYVISSACAQGEGIVLVKKGIYIGTSLNLSYPNVRLIGEGQGTILQFTEGITVSNTTESYHQEVSNLQLVGSGYANNGLTLSTASRFVSYNLIVQNYNAGVYIKSSPSGATIFNNFYSLMSHDNNIGVYVKRDPGGDTVAHNSFYGGSIVTNLQWGVVIMGSASNEIFEGVEIENNCHGQVRLSTLTPGLVPEGNTFSKCYFEPWPINTSAPFIEFTTELSPDTKPWGNIFKENKFAVCGDTTLTLPTNTIFTNNYISGAHATFTIIATASGCQVEGNINPTGEVKVNYVGTGNTGRIMQYSHTDLVASSSWVDFGATFPKGPVVYVSVTGNGMVIDAWAYQIEKTRFYLVMFYSNGTEVTTPQYVMWTATLNLP